MLARSSVFRLAAVAAAAGVGLTFWTWSRAQQPKPPTPDKTAELGGAERRLTHISTDKPIYRPGEKLYVRAVVLNAADRTPVKAEQSGQLSGNIEIKGPKGDTVAGGMVQCQDSVIGFAWDIPKETPGGEYVIKLSHPWSGDAPAERKFDIRAYRAPRLKTDITFLRDGYGPGDRVQAVLHAERAEGGIPANAKVTAVARVDGVQVWTGPARIDAQGNCQVAFELPKQIARGDGTLAMIVEDGGISETASKTLPILLQTVDLKMYPEGGDLIAGVPNRVYIEARTTVGKPADLAGEVVDSQGKAVAAFRTSHEGRGAYRFTPAAGGVYSLRITEPSGIKAAFPLPAVKADGVALTAAPAGIDAARQVFVTIASPTAGKRTVVLSRREIEVARVEVDLRAGQPTAVSLVPAAGKPAEGVLTVTVLNDKGVPTAERLVFRTPEKSLRIVVTADKKTAYPGDRVSLTVKTTDAAGKPVGAVVGMSVVDDAVLKMIEKRERAPRLAVMALLESEVRELADSEIYFDEKDPKAAEATDLLLGTQGWRRFALVDTAKFLAAAGDAGRRALALRIVTEREHLAKFRNGRDGRPGEARLGAVDLAAAVPVPDAPPAKQAGEPKGPAADKPALLELERKQLRDALEQAEGRAADRQIAAGARAPRAEMNARNDFALVRVYAHDLRPGRQPNDRVDFAETLYWNAGVKTDAKTGEAVVSFAVSDSVTTFRVFADGFAADGALGGASAAVESLRPFYIEPKLPLEVTAGDRIILPVGVVNGVTEAAVRITATANTKTAGSESEMRISVVPPFVAKAGARERRNVEIGVGVLNGSVDLMVSAEAGAFSDKVTRSLSIKPHGFPVEFAKGGLIGPGAKQSHKIVIPADVVARSIQTSLAVYPTPLASLTEALARLIREPNGCFEQTSSTTYPLTMAQQYFLSHTGVDPKLVEKSREILDRGYKRLIGFECPKKGYEWFGADPGHDSLSAYGLLQFTDMQQVREVDAAMLARTRAWLLAQRDGKGGFARKTHTYHVWVSTPEVSNGYTLWALLESGEKGMEKEIAWLKDAAAKSANSYVVAQAANVMALAGDKPAAKALMDRLVAKQAKDGSVSGATQTMVGSGGDAMTIETTSLAVLAWLRDKDYAGAVENAMKYLAESCKGGRFGSTQSTVLALRAIVAYDKARARPKAPGRVQLLVNGRPVGGAVPFGDAQQGPIVLPDFSELMTKGKEHVIEVQMIEGGEMPYSLAVRFHTVKPASSAECKVGLAVTLADTKIVEGGITEANVTVTNLTKDILPTPISIIGLPGGLEPRHDQLKELVKAGRIAAYEVIGREVVLYWRAFQPGEKVQLPISLTAAIPGTYTGPAGRAYLYYTDEHKNWADGLKAEITPRGGN